MTTMSASQQETVRLSIDGKDLDLPVLTGTESEKAIDINKLRATTGYITFDDGFKNTGSCQSEITFIDGEAGILRYRGYPIEELAEHSSFTETAYLIMFGELPTRAELDSFNQMIVRHTPIHVNLENNFNGFSSDAHPMAILSAMFNAVSCYSPHLLRVDFDRPAFTEAAARLLGKTSTIAAYAYRKAIGRPFIFPDPSLDYCSNFLHMMFSEPYRRFEAPPEVTSALDLILILHADHEQNCSTSTVRMVGSSQANLFASISAGVCALWGPLHGGANTAVLKMLEKIHASGMTIDECVRQAKDKNSTFRLMGFGHRVYKNFDPRARILKKACDNVLDALKIDDPLLEIAKRLEEVALSDSYFVERNLYPNVDFYSGIIMRALGIPVNMFTVMFAMGRMPGWIANWNEVRENPKAAIYRPRQIYQGPTKRPYLSIDERG